MKNVSKIMAEGMDEGLEPISEAVCKSNSAQLTPQALDVCDGRREEHQIGGNFIVSEHMPGGMLGAAS